MNGLKMKEPVDVWLAELYLFIDVWLSFSFKEKYICFHPKTCKF